MITAKRRRLFASCLVLASICLYLRMKTDQFSPQAVAAALRPFHQEVEEWTSDATQDEANDATIVVASVAKSNTSWLQSELSSFGHQIYVVDDPTAEFTVPMNKGREAMVFLTHIIDNYDDLSSVTVFLHADRYQWHNDDPDYDNVRLLRRLNKAHVQEQGYANLRCAWLFGCSTDLFPLKSEKEFQLELQKDPTSTPGFEQVYAKAFEHLMPGTSVPEHVQVACCAQFAASKEAIRRRSREDYVRYRKWIVDSEYDDGITGRVFEFLWHVMFGKEAISCPTAESCYCSTYGICDLECEDEGDCKRYDFPPDGTGQTFPEAWPAVGFDGTERQPHTDEEGDYNALEDMAIDE